MIFNPSVNTKSCTKKKKKYTTGKYGLTEKGTMERKAFTKNSTSLFVPVQEM